MTSAARFREVNPFFGRSWWFNGASFWLVLAIFSRMRGSLSGLGLAVLTRFNGVFSDLVYGILLQGCCSSTPWVLSNRFSVMAYAFGGQSVQGQALDITG